MRAIYFFLCFFLASCAQSIVSIDSSKIDYEDIPNYEILSYYSLPKTVLRIKVPVAKKKPKPGIAIKNSCALELVKTYFGWEPVKVPEEIFALDKKITISTLAVPDPKKRYALSYRKSKSLAQSLNLSFSKDGFIQSGEFAQESKVFDITKKSIEILGNAVGALSGLGSEAMGDIKTKDCTLDSLKDERIKRLIKDAFKLYGIQYSLINKPTNSVNSTDIVKYHLKEVDKQLKTIKNVLMGYISKDIYYVTLDIDPKEDFKSIELLQLDPKKGLLAPAGNKAFNKLSSQISVANSSKTKKLELKAKKLINAQKIDVREPRTILVEGEQGKELNVDAFLYYNIPSKYELFLVYDGKPLSSYSSSEDKKGKDVYTAFFPQIGKVAYLPKDFKEANVVYYEDIGALKSVKFVKEPDVTAERVEGIYMALDSIRKVSKALKEKKKEENKEDVEEVEQEIMEQVIRLIIENGNAVPSAND
ncbi:DUF4831 family protein [Flagellimonas sp. 389]|uniref:DUF4831 family protein n=1 Tax=Flagellimonas sp. 389 TaxID=2835862 RepID=UPI001BD54EE8|nr:DUF4831 family protein [Flagellimonas sp. 389]MBS9462883.1 DUF4831 family protein [Flagellimonas sp. 389]